VKETPRRKHSNSLVVQVTPSRNNRVVNVDIETPPSQPGTDSQRTTLESQHYTTRKPPQFKLTLQLNNPVSQQESQVAMTPTNRKRKTKQPALRAYSDEPFNDMPLEPFKTPEQPSKRTKIVQSITNLEKELDAVVQTKRLSSQVEEISEFSDLPPSTPPRKANLNRRAATTSKKNKVNYPYLQVVRKRSDRKQMHGMDCECCKNYYELTGALPRLPELGTEDLPKMVTPQERMQTMSRHRTHHVKQHNTPDDFWDIGFGDTPPSQPAAQ
jgi:hypothetical protein